MVLSLTLVTLWAFPAPVESQGALSPWPAYRIDSPDERIVNGVDTVEFPSVVALIQSGAEFCTGTFIGCETVLTAAHCVCESTGANCQPGGADLANPASIQVFAQHAGIFSVTSIAVPSTYVFGSTSDVAVLQLGSAVGGVSPTPINTTAKPAAGTPGQITGFGLTQGTGSDNGIKRTGSVQIADCSSVSNSTHVCWFFNNPLGSPGEDSNTCSGDSGGPLFVDAGSGLVVAGVTSGGFSSSCLPPDEAFDADVFGNRTFIQSVGGSDLANTTCGVLAQAGTADAPIVSGAGTLSAGNVSDTFSFHVPAGTEVLRATLNGEDGSGNDFDLYLKLGSAPTTSDFDCRGIRTGNYEACEISSPQAGDWFFMARRFSGSGDYQLVVTKFLSAAAIFTDGFESGDVSAWSKSVP